MRRSPVAPWLVACFLVSGFCGLVYQVVWLRLAMTAFGVNTPVVSAVVSAFMGGLALGNWAGGSWARGKRLESSRQPLRLYALAECAVALWQPAFSCCLGCPSAGLSGVSSFPSRLWRSSRRGP
jgi:spermidine synthase